MPHLSTPVRTAVVAGCVALLAGTAAFVGAGSALAALPAQNETVMVSVDASTPPGMGDRDSFGNSVSADGRFVTFESISTDLVSIPNQAHSQVYKRDMVAGTTSLVSVAASGLASGDGNSIEPSISADGRFVSFTSTAPDLTLPTDPGNLSAQIFVRDTVMGTTRKLSFTPGLIKGGDGDSTQSSISADGALVAFQSMADDLVTGLTPVDTQVYVAKNAVIPSIRLVSVQEDSVNGIPNDDSVHPSISGDGRVVAFASSARDLTNVPGNGKIQVYERDLSKALTKMLTFSNSDPSFAAAGDSDNPSVSFDGSRIAYDSAAPDLVKGRAFTDLHQIYVFDGALMGNALVSFNKSNTTGGFGFSDAPAISADGTVIAFASSATDLTPISSNRAIQIYVRDTVSSATRAVSVQKADRSQGGTLSSGEVAISADGDFIGFTSQAEGLSATPADGIRKEAYLSAVAVADPTPTPTPTPTGTAPPTATPTSGTMVPSPSATMPGTGGTSGGGHLASTGMSQTPIIVAAAVAGVLALIGGSILYGAHSAKRRRAQAASPSSPSSPLPDTDE